MSGHEKFYIPHDDLVSLEAAIATLETDIETLNTNIETLITAFVLPSSETRVTGNATMEAAYDTDTLFSQALDADHDRYITKARMRLLTLADPFTDYKADAFFFMSVGGNVIMSEFLCDGIHPALPIDAGESFWIATRMVEIPHALVAAGATITASVTSYKLEDDAAAIFDIWHVKGL